MSSLFFPYRQEFAITPPLAFPTFSVLPRVRVLLPLRQALTGSSRARIRIISIIRGMLRPVANGESHSLTNSTRWRPFDPARHWPDLGPRFAEGERAARAAANPDADPDEWVDEIDDDKVDLDWATVLKRTFESYIRGERPNMYGEWLHW